ncbi:hypothetical protein RIF29_13805 [Crotalaria pallida]|uniref:Uncharacterized protein n=1 Tax=Crotalaria pallida TaxID=3830 RepID=A0AAN9IQ21_CROPI
MYIEPFFFPPLNRFFWSIPWQLFCTIWFLPSQKIEKSLLYLASMEALEITSQLSVSTNFTSTEITTQHEIDSSSIMKNIMKKLKFWSKRRRKKKALLHYNEPCYPPPPPPPPPCCHYYCCSSSPSPSSAQPSAPPLPSSTSCSWLEESAQHNNYGTFSFLAQQETPTLDATVTTSSSTLSYQQYLVSDSEPVYGIPVPAEIQTAATEERSSGQFGYVFSFGAYLVRCLCPCFRIRQQQQQRLLV